jgi:thiamine biosynthesis protein ThiS
VISNVTVQLNGQARAVDARTVVDLLKSLDIDPRTVVVELNRSIVNTSNARPSSRWPTGVVPPSPTMNATQNPSSNGRSLATMEPRRKMKGSARTNAPVMRRAVVRTYW